MILRQEPDRETKRKVPVPMNPYITPKLKSTPPLKKPLLFLYAFLALLFLATLPSLLADGSILSAVIALLFAAAFSYPVYSHFREKRERQEAKELASHLSGISDEEVSMGRFVKLVPIPQVIRKTERYIRLGYLENIHTNWEKKTVVLTAVSKAVQDGRYMEITCDSCGATALVIRGRVSKCEYCGSPLIGK